MSALTESVTDGLHYTPTANELLPNYKISCSQPSCSSTFTNSGNYQLHLMRHHHVKPKPRFADATEYYHCPEESCIYNQQQKGGRYFTALRYVRQHYHKVHAEKTFKCSNCEKTCLTAQQLQKHKLQECGKKFTCNECGWQYNTMEALIFHGKRKQHVIKETDNIKVAIPRLQVKRLNSNKRKQKTQIKPKPKLLNDQATQTDNTQSAGTTETDLLHSTTQTNFSELFDVEALLRDIETQTEPPVEQNVGKKVDALLPANENEYFDPMMVSSSDIHTQTCDLFTELGFTNIETQTCWPEANVSCSPMYSSSAHDIDMFVSTETQTNSAGWLLDAATCTTEHEFQALDGESSFYQLYTSQCTQTCDTLLDRLIGAQHTDLVGNEFQNP